MSSILFVDIYLDQTRPLIKSNRCVVQFVKLIKMIKNLLNPEIDEGSKKINTEEDKPRVAKSAVDLQRLKLQKLMKNPVSNV